MIDITDILKAVLTLAVSVVTTFLIPLIKSKVDADRLAKAKAWVDIAVKAADQSVSGGGDEKKAYVLNFLAEKGVSVNLPEVDALVEAAVLDVKKRIC